jgi:hypothetical protein
MAGRLVVEIAADRRAETGDLDAARRTVSKGGRRPLLPMRGTSRMWHVAHLGYL